MTSQSSQFIGSIPENYDQGLGPYIFHQYAQDLAARVAEACSHLTSGKVLEIASGTGIVTRKLRDGLSPGLDLVGSDLNPPMLTVAQGKFAAEEKVTFKPADAMGLPFEEAEFDLLTCQFGVMFFPDKIQAYREAARVLKPGGRYIFNVWGDMADNPFSAITHATVATYYPKDPPGFYKVPFSYADQDLVTTELSAGGFKDIACETVRFEQKVSDWSSFARGLIYGNPLIDEINARGGVDPEAIVRSIETALSEAFGPDDGTMPLLAKVYSATVA